jgi:predicted phosphodiesterase
MKLKNGKSFSCVALLAGASRDGRRGVQPISTEPLVAGVLVAGLDSGGPGLARRASRDCSFTFVRYLIVSDIHANWEALEAVLQHAQGTYEKILCCGDLVGYGADPNPVVDWAREAVTVVVRGNHDKACVGLDDLEWFNPVARTAALWTENALTPENLSYLRNLPKGPLTVDSFQILHGSPLDEDEYLISTLAASQVTAYLEVSPSFFGHTHLQGGFVFRRTGVRRIEKLGAQVQQRVVHLKDDALYLINPGSVGQPRDGDPRAAYLIYDTGEHRLEYRRVSYPVAAAQAKIRNAGLPHVLADRLAVGV